MNTITKSNVFLNIYTLYESNILMISFDGNSNAFVKISIQKNNNFEYLNVILEDSFHILKYYILKKKEIIILRIILY